MARSIAFIVLLSLIVITGISGAVEPVLLFEDDFSSNVVGSRPSGWSVSTNAGHIEVVADPNAVGGKAVRIIGDQRRASQFAITLPSDDPITIVEHSLRWEKGFGLNYWLGYAGEGSFGKHNINWYPDGSGGLMFTYTDAESGRAVRAVVGSLIDGWNQIKIVADWEKQQSYITLNDVDELGPVPLWNVIDDPWTQIRLTFYDTGRWTDASSVSQTESYYDDVKIWTVPWDEAKEYRRVLEGQPVTSYEPAWIEYSDVAQRPVEWWRSDEARALGNRIIGYFQKGVYYIDIPVQLLDVPDGIMSTQLLALAQLYGATGQSRYKEAFLQGIETLLNAQFPSGLWPTTYPNDRFQDLVKDKFSRDSWESIPVLFNAIIEKRSPFDTDLVDAIDPGRLQAALDRIPPRQSIREFQLSDYTRQPDVWWASDEARKIADNLLTWQTDLGGWERIIGMAAVPFMEGQHIHRGTPFADGIERGDFLRGRTTEPMRFVARVYDATGETRYLESFYRALEFVLDAQYDTGGWPRHYPMVGNNPQATPFSNAATFYNDAIPITLELIQDIIEGRPPFGFVDKKYIPRLEKAFEQGIDFIVKVQIEVDGRLTGWGQRYNPVTLKPVAGRAFEPVAINPWVTVGVIRLLQSVPNPSPDVRRAILTALEWLEDYQLPDGRWAMFYELGTFRPIFAGRDAVIRYSLSEIELERQLGYAWYGTWPKQLLDDARESGYFDELYMSLPDHPTVRVRFASLKDGERVSGVVPIDLELLHGSKAAGIESVIVDIDGEVIYDQASIPANGELQFNTENLGDGRRVITVTTTHKELGTFRQSVTMNVDNWWRLVQNMAPPMTQGWFGTIDFLETSDRSDGWRYETGQSGIFYGDPQRLMRASDSAQYLIWETKRLQTVTLTAFIQPNTDLSEGLLLETSVDGANWTPVDYELSVDGDGQPWHRAAISLDLSDGLQSNWFRLTLTDVLPKEAVQIGEVVFAGFKN